MQNAQNVHSFMLLIDLFTLQCSANFTQPHFSEGGGFNYTPWAAE